MNTFTSVHQNKVTVYLPQEAEINIQNDTAKKAAICKLAKKLNIPTEAITLRELPTCASFPCSPEAVNLRDAAVRYLKTGSVGLSDAIEADEKKY